MEDRKKIFLDKVFRKKIAEVDFKRALSKANIDFSEEEFLNLKAEINQVLSDNKKVFSEARLRSSRLEELELSAFSFNSVLFAIEKLEESRGPSQLLAAIKKQAKKHERLYGLIQM